jgi:hypothetical protein
MHSNTCMIIGPPDEKISYEIKAVIFEALARNRRKHDQQNVIDKFSLHKECEKRIYDSSIISRHIEQSPESLAVIDGGGNLPLHCLLRNHFTSTNDVLMMIEKYPEALKRQNSYGDLPLHLECETQGRSSVITKCIELYPEALATADSALNLPLHRFLHNTSSTIDVALMIIEKYPAALKRRIDLNTALPLHIECMFRCRPPIILRCIELYPESLDDRAIESIFTIVRESNFRTYAPVLTVIVTARPMSLYEIKRNWEYKMDIRYDPIYRRRILNLLLRHLFTPKHESEYRDLNWQSRVAMMMLLSQMKIQQQIAQ